MTKTAAPAFDINKAVAQYGVVAQIVNAIPELQTALQEAIKSQLSPDAFNAKIAATPWYKQHSQGLRDLLMLHASDPATYTQNLNTQVWKVHMAAAQMGRNVDLNSVALASMAGGWTDAELNAYIGTKGTLVHQSGTGGALTGSAAQIESHLRQTAAAYGVPVTDKTISDSIQKIQVGHDTTDGFDALMKARAKAAFPHLATQIDAGMTVQQIADPYMATYAKTLELPQSTVTLSTPAIRKALLSQDPKTGQPTSQPLWQFEQTVKADPRYDKTDQAKTDAYSTLAQVGKDWGFSA